MGQPFKLLGIQENGQDYDAIQQGLQRLGLSVKLDRVDSIATVLSNVNVDPYDCILLAPSFPNGDGLALVKALRQREVSIPIVVLTGRDGESAYAHWIKAGASDCLPQSDVLPERLFQSICTALRLQRAETEVALARQRLADREARYQTLLKHASDLVIVISPEGLVSYVSPSVVSLLGYQAHTFVGQGLFTLLHPDDKPATLKKIETVLETPGVLQSMAFRLQHVSGTWVYWASQVNNLLSDPQINGIVLNAHEITHQKQVEAAQQFLADASALLSSSLDYQNTLTQLARRAVIDLADWCIIDLVQTNQHYHRLTVAHRNPKIEALIWEPISHSLVIAGTTLGYSQVLQTGAPEVYFHIPDQPFDHHQGESNYLKALRPLHPCSYLCVPLLMGDQILGAITLGLSESYRCYGHSDLVLAQELAQRIALAIENAHLYQESQNIGESLQQAIEVLGRQQQQLKTLQNLTNLLNQRLDNLPLLLNVMVNAVCDVIPGAEFSLIGLNDGHQDEMKLTASTGISMEQLQQVPWFNPESEGWSQLFAHGESQWQGPMAPLNRNSGEVPASLYAMPIDAAQGDSLGVLAIGNWQQTLAFEPEDYQLLEAFAKQAAIAIRNAQLINILEEREERLANQNEILIQQNEELERQRQQIQAQSLKVMEAAQMKSKFLATMSHELRTPINAITGFSQLLLRQRQYSLSEHQIDMVERILNNGNNLLDLINDILDLSKIEAGRMELHLEEVNLHQLITVTVAELASLAHQKGLSLDIAIHLDNPHITNDSTRLRQILVNLLSNAIKFTEQGSVQVVASEVRPDYLAIAVKDTGIGITPSHLKQIFSEFWQADQTTTRKYPGTGLGLSICQRLVHLMGGQIEAESKINQGSTFRVEVPRQVIANSWAQPSGESGG